jgi:hypothetical protein
VHALNFVLVFLDGMKTRKDANDLLGIPPNSQSGRVLDVGISPAKGSKVLIEEQGTGNSLRLFAPYPL